MLLTCFDHNSVGHSQGGALQKRFKPMHKYTKF